MKRRPITIEGAQKIAYSILHTTGQEEISLLESAGRILVHDVKALRNCPPFRRSAMDGYAVCCADLRDASAMNRITLPVAGCNDAGIPEVPCLRRGETVRIMTGGVVPEGADAVIREEDVLRESGETVSFQHAPRPGQYISPVGEDAPEGEVLALAGDPIDASAMAAFAAAGITVLPVRKKVRVAVLSTGDELVLPEEDRILKLGQIIGSSHLYLWTRLTELGCELIMEESPLAGDDPAEIADRIRSLLGKGAEIVLTTGGVSAGRKDYLPEVIRLLGGEVLFHGIDCKPGMPSMLSLVNGVPILSLSGNPYSCTCIFELIGRPMLKRMLGERNAEEKIGLFPAADAYPKASPVRRILRGRFDGTSVSFSSRQRNAQMAAGIGCNCLIDIAAGTPGIQKGDLLRVILL